MFILFFFLWYLSLRIDTFCNQVLPQGALYMSPSKERDEATASQDWNEVFQSLFFLDLRSVVVLGWKRDVVEMSLRGPPSSLPLSLAQVILVVSFPVKPIIFYHDPHEPINQIVAVKFESCCCQLSFHSNRWDPRRPHSRARGSSYTVLIGGPAPHHILLCRHSSPLPSFDTAAVETQSFIYICQD